MTGQLKLQHYLTCVMKLYGLNKCYVRQTVNDGSINLVYCESQKNIADLMTKPLCAKRHQKLVEKLGMLTQEAVVIFRLSKMEGCQCVHKKYSV